MKTTWKLISTIYQSELEEKLNNVNKEYDIVNIFFSTAVTTNSQIDVYYSVLVEVTEKDSDADAIQRIQ